MTTESWEKRKARKFSPKDRMLEDFLRAPTAEQKRKVIEQFAPHYFLLPPTKENEHERRLQTSS
jgi:hypothetical protein